MKTYKYEDDIELNKKENEIITACRKKHFFNPSDGFEYLLKNKDDLRMEIYATILRIFFKLNTRNVSRELLVKVFDGIGKEYLMDKTEIEIFNNLPNEVILYRGTDRNEVVPRLSWSLDREIGYKWYALNMGRLFIGKANKNNDIYFLCNDNEKEVVANVKEFEYNDV